MRNEPKREGTWRLFRDWVSLTSSWADSREHWPVVTHLLLPLPVASRLQFLLCQELARRVEEARGLCARVLLRPKSRSGQRDT